MPRAIVLRAGGTGDSSCDVCGGTGKVICSKCNGTGSTTTSVNCEHNYSDAHYYCALSTDNHGTNVSEYH